MSGQPIDVILIEQDGVWTPAVQTSDGGQIDLADFDTPGAAVDAAHKWGRDRGRTLGFFTLQLLVLPAAPSVAVPPEEETP